MATGVTGRAGPGAKWPAREWLPWVAGALWVAGAIGLGYWGRRGDWSPGEIVLAGCAWVAVLAIAARDGVRHMFGPVFLYEVVRVGRRRFTFALRLFYILCVMALLGMMFLSWLEDIGYFDYHSTKHVPPERLANFADRFFQTFILVQFCVVVFLTPAYVAGTVADEKERKTLEFLLATDLRNREIIFGKLAARVTVLLTFVLAGLPVIAFLQLFGGIDPDQLLAAVAATLLTVLGLSALGLAYSTALRRPRDAIALTYLTAALYGVLSLFVPAYTRFALSPMGYTAVSVAGYDFDLADATDWFGAGNVAYAIVSMINPRTGGGISGTAVGAALLRYALVWGIATVLLLGYSIWRLRAVALHQSYGAPKGGGRRAGRRRGPPARPEIGTDPMIWKEVYADSGTRSGLAGRVVGGVIVCLVFLVPAVMIVVTFGDAFELYREWFKVPRSSETLHRRWDDLTRELNGWVRVATGLLGLLAMLGAAIRGAGVVSGERDKDTWVSLVSTPLTAWEMLRGKWLGCVLGLRPLYVAILLCWGLALAFGAVDPPMVALAALYLAVYVSGFAWVGIFCSISARNTLNASVRALAAAVFLAGGFWAFCGLCCAMPMSIIFHGPEHALVDYGAQMLLGCTPPFVVGWVPLMHYQHSDMGPFSWDEPRAIGPLAPVIGLVVWIGFNCVFGWVSWKKFVEATNRGRDDLIGRPPPAPTRGGPPGRVPRPVPAHPLRDASPKANDGSTDKASDEPIIFD